MPTRSGLRTAAHARQLAAAALSDQHDTTRRCRSASRSSATRFAPTARSAQSVLSQHAALAPCASRACRSQPASTPSDWSPAMKPGHEQHGRRVPAALRREEPRVRGKPGKLESVTELSTQRGRRGKGRHAGSRNPGPGSGVTLCADISRPHLPHTSMGAAISPQSW